MFVLILALMDTLSTDVDVPAWAYVVLTIWWVCVVVGNVLAD